MAEYKFDANVENFSLIVIFVFMQYGPLEGVLFADYGSDLGSGPTVPGKLVSE